MTIENFKTIFDKIYLCSGSEIIKVEITNLKTGENIAKYDDIIDFICDKKFDELKITNQFRPTLFTALNHISIFIEED